MTREILVCAATGTEASACRRGIADAGASGFEVLETGVGPARAAAALRRRLGAADLAPALVVSSGFAGALTGGVAPLSWVTASGVYRLVGGRPVAVELPPGRLRLAEAATPCQFVTAEHAVAREAPGLSGPVAVDMESAVLAEVANEAGLPFLVLRLVTDTPDRPLAALGRRLALALAAEGVADRAARGAGAALEAARSPLRSAAFIRDSLGWRARLRAGWREQARRGLPAD